MPHRGQCEVDHCHRPTEKEKRYPLFASKHGAVSMAEMTLAMQLQLARSLVVMTEFALGQAMSSGLLPPHGESELDHRPAEKEQRYLWFASSHDAVSTVELTLVLQLHLTRSLVVVIAFVASRHIRVGLARSSGHLPHRGQPASVAQCLRVGLAKRSDLSSPRGQPEVDQCYRPIEEVQRYPLFVGQ